MSKQPPPAPTASTEGPCPTLSQISRTPRHWKFAQHHRTTRPPLERGERIDESKNVQTTPTRTYCKCNRPLPYCNQNCRTPRTGSLPSTIAPPDHSLLWETARYRQKYCLKGPLNPKQPTNQPTLMSMYIPIL